MRINTRRRRYSKKRDTWQLRVLWLASNYPGNPRIWYEVINRLEINQAFTRVAIIDQISQRRRRKPVHFDQAKQRYEVASKGVG